MYSFKLERWIIFLFIMLNSDIFRCSFHLSFGFLFVKDNQFEKPNNAYLSIVLSLKCTLSLARIFNVCTKHTDTKYFNRIIMKLSFETCRYMLLILYLIVCEFRNWKFCCCRTIKWNYSTMVNRHTKCTVHAYALFGLYLNYVVF